MPWGRNRGGRARAPPESIPLSIESIVRREVVTASPTTSVADIADLLVEENVGSVVIVEDDRPIGIVTDRDLVSVLSDDRSASDVTAETLMGDVVTASADSSVSDVIQRMVEARVRRLPVVDEDDELVGIVTLDDFVRLFATELQELATIIETEMPRRDD